MSLSITFRPQKDLYAVNPPTAYDEAYYNSRWVSGHLPIQYKILNTKFPVNSDDDVNNVCAVSDVNGFAQINLCGTYETYVKYEYIKIEDSTNTSYNGVWQILDVVNATTLTISAAYDGTATATVQRYYNNYHNLVKVYAGIPSYHQYDSEDPMSLIATLKITPNTSNLSIADISGLVKAKLNCDNDLDQISGANDLNSWTGFYIEYAESYDTSDGLEVSQFTSEYTTDNNPDCTETQIITNGDFATNLNGWTNGSTGSDFVFDSGKASATKGANELSKFLYQQTDLLQGVSYNVLASVTNNEANAMQFAILLFDGTALTTGTVIYSGSISGTTNVNISIIPSKDYPVIGYRILFQGTTAQKGSLDNLSVTASDCTYYGFAINGTRQFQNLLGGNFGDYVQNFNTELVLNKFLTHFVSPIWFNSLYFDLSTIIPKSTFSATNDRQLYYYIKEYTEGGGFIQRQDITLVSKDDGVYRLPISDLTLDSDTENFDLQIYQLPTNRLVDGNAGTFEYTVNPAGDPASDWGITKGSIQTFIRSSNFAHSGVYSAEVTTSPPYSIGVSTLWTTTSNIAVTANSEYIIEGWVLKDSTNTQYNGSTVYFEAVGISSILTQSYTITDTNEVWNYVKTVFNTGVNTNITIRARINILTTVTVEDVVLYFDDITVKGPVENLSEIKNITVDNSCTKQNIYLSWLNNLGRWEYFNFKAEKEYGVDIDSAKSITRDTLVNWDTDFINGETQDDFISIEAAETIKVRSQFMTLAQLNAVLQIRYAIRVQEIRSDNTKITVLVDKGSFKRYSDGDKLYQIEFDIKYPKIEIQTQ